jgi:excisionase family DNA binding protein
MPNDFDIASIPLADIPPLVSALMMRLIRVAEPARPNAGETATNGVDDEWLTANEAAKFLRCSTKTLYRRAKQMSSCRRRNGRTLLFSKAGLAKWLTRQRA